MTTPSDPTVIEPATLRLVALCLDQLRRYVPPSPTNKGSSLYVDVVGEE